MSVLDPVIDHLDPAAKLIYLRANATEYHPVTDIYAEVRQLRRVDETLRRYDMPIKAFGNITKGGGKFTPRYAVFYNGWKVVPWDATHTLYISGEQITDDGQSGPAVLNTSVLSAGTNVTIHYEPPAAEIVRADAEILAIQHMSFNDGVTLDVMSQYSGTSGLIGNPQFPVNNIRDAVIIAVDRSLSNIYIKGDLELSWGDDVSGMVLIGESPGRTTLTLPMETDETENGKALTWGATLRNLTVTGRCGGTMDMEDCHMVDLYGLCASFFPAKLVRCVLMGKIQFRSFADQMFNFIDCYGPYGSRHPDINVNGSSAQINFFNYGGALHVSGGSQPSQELSIGFSSGELKIEPTFTAGNLYITGVVKLLNETIPNDNLVVGISGLSQPVSELYKSRVFISTNGQAGSEYPLGLFDTPDNNLADAIKIAKRYQCNDLHFHSDYTVESGTNLHHYIISGHEHHAVTFQSGCDIDNLIFRNIVISGNLGGDHEFTNCLLKNVSGLAGKMTNCLMEGYIVLGKMAHWSGIRSHSQEPIQLIINGAMVNGTNTFGMFNLSSKTGLEECNIHFSYGFVHVDETCVAGDIYLAGVGHVTNNANGSNVIVDMHSTRQEIATEVLSILSNNTIPVNVKQMNDATLFGSGSESDKWRGSDV